MRDGKIAEVRAYHHGDKKNPQGDLLGFDHAGRGYTTLEDWRPPSPSSRTPASARPSRPSPRSTRSCASRSAASSARRSRRTSTSGRRRASSRASSTPAAASSASSASSTRPSTAARAATTSTTRSGSRSSRAPAAAAGSPPGIGAHAEIATPPIWKFGTEEQKQRWLVPGIKGEKIGALGITEPGAGSDVASLRTTRPQGRRRLRRQRLQDLHHQRRARRLPRLRLQDHRGGRPPRHLLPRAGARHARLRGRLEAGEDGLARLRHRRALLHRRRGARGEPARRGERGLLPDHGQLPVGAADDGARRASAGCSASSRRRSTTPRSARPSAGRSAASRRSATSSPRCR